MDEQSPSTLSTVRLVARTQAFHACNMSSILIRCIDNACIPAQGSYKHYLKRVSRVATINARMAKSADAQDLKS